MGLNMKSKKLCIYVSNTDMYKHEPCISFLHAQPESWAWLV